VIAVRKTEDRGHFDYGWLETYHTFSFGAYRDPDHMGFRSLRVINEDRVQPGQGFSTHPHKEMEIVSYVLDGALEHRDSLGNGSVIHAGEVQKMSAGTGVTHSEYNHSQTEIVHFLQIWILPERKGLEPSYEQRSFAEHERRDTLRLIASRDGGDGSVTIHQDVSIYLTVLDPGQQVVHRLSADRHAWVHVARGRVGLNGHGLAAGDGAAVSDEESLTIAGEEAAEVLLFDLA
jgi:redox-sensitive bicupin YhaK (pirin superfamily)